MYFVHVYIYIYIFKIYKKKIQKKISRFPNLSQKRENFSKNKKKKKGLWTRGIEPLSHFKKKKKKFFKLGALDFLVTFQKRPIFFFQRFQDSLKSSFQNCT